MLRLSPRSAAVYVRRGRLFLHNLGDPEAAARDFDNAVAIDPASAVALAGRAELRVERGDLAGAAADLTRALEVEPRCASAFKVRARLRRAQGDVAGALADFARATRLDRGLSSAYLEHGRLLEAEARFPEAEAEYSRALRTMPGSYLGVRAEIHGRRGVIRLRGERFVDAIADFDAAIELLGQAARWDLFMNRALCREAAGRAGALVDLSIAIQREPAAHQARVHRARILLKARGDWAGAEAALRRIETRWGAALADLVASAARRDAGAMTHELEQARAIAPKPLRETIRWLVKELRRQLDGG